MAREESLKLRQLITGYWISQSIYAVAKLGIADRIASGLTHVPALAKALGYDADALTRLLRALASVGLFRQIGEDCFELNELSELLRTDVASSLRDYAIMNGEEQFLAWGKLLDSLKDGRQSFDKSFGEPFFPYLARHPQSEETFQKAMVSVSAEQTRAVLESYDFEGLESLVDVGGGYGGLLFEILRAHPALRGVLFDVPQVIDRVTALPEHCTVARGDFFKEIPSGHDGYLLKYILHDWNDEKATVILKNCRRAISPRGKLLVVEQVVPPGDRPFFGKLTDLHMLVLLGGKERTEPQFRKLFEGAGFRLHRVLPTPYVMSVIEALPA